MASMPPLVIIGDRGVHAGDRMIDHRRRDADDAAAALLRQHLPDDALREMQEPFEICRRPGDEVLDRVVDERLGEEDAGIVDQSVDRAEPRKRGFDDRLWPSPDRAMSPSTRAKRSDALISADWLTRREVATTL